MPLGSYEVVLMECADWDALRSDWQDQCSTFGEDLEQYGTESMPVLASLVASPVRRAGVVAIKDDEGTYHAAWQANTTALPGTIGDTLRMRHMMLAPRYDFGTYDVKDYSNLLGKMFTANVALATQGPLKAQHVKLHLRSPADQSFFSALAGPLSGLTLFTDVNLRGAWLYVTLADREQLQSMGTK